MSRVTRGSSKPASEASRSAAARFRHQRAAHLVAQPMNGSSRGSPQPTPPPSAHPPERAVFHAAKRSRRARHVGGGVGASQSPPTGCEPCVSSGAARGGTLARARVAARKVGAAGACLTVRRRLRDQPKISAAAERSPSLRVPVDADQPACSPRPDGSEVEDARAHEGGGGRQNWRDAEVLVRRREKPLA